MKGINAGGTQWDLRFAPPSQLDVQRFDRCDPWSFDGHHKFFGRSERLRGTPHQDLVEKIHYVSWEVTGWLRYWANPSSQLR